LPILKIHIKMLLVLLFVFFLCFHDKSEVVLT
jgi:hypothetical protein